ncbi:MAG: FG-GAP-like repeat-containing protein [Methanomassiliicoccales archaeon]|nr:FG-GAP-like repeat-containing protein [Methanomassiliicoccales archaeon]
MRFDKQLRRCRRAVSEIIGNLLILAITVTLFSSVMFYVMNMPSPEEDTYADMNYEISDLLSDNSRWVNITHKGGQTLINSSTDIYIYEYDSVLSAYNAFAVYISNSTPSIGEEWTPGETWCYCLTDIDENTPISIIIVDTSTGDAVWDADLVGGQVTTTYAPIIGNRGTTPSTIVAGSTFIIYATVSDPNDDLDENSVYVNATSAGLDWVHLTDSNNDGVYTSGSLTGTLAMDGKVVLINATDDEGKTTKTQMTLSAEQAGGSGGNTTEYYGPFNDYLGYFVNGTYPPNASGGESDDGGTTFYYIRNSDDEITREFEAGESYYIEIYSNVLTNLARENAFYIYNPSTGAAMSESQTSDAFSYGGIYATFYRYYINLTAPSLTLIYPLEICLKDNTGTVVDIYDSISVSGAIYPIIKTYKLVGTALEETTSFNHTDVIYVKIFTKDVDSSITAVTMNSLEINSYTGKYIIKQSMPTANTYTSSSDDATLAENSPITQIYKTLKSSLTPTRQYDWVTTNTVYTIQVDLLDANQGWWLSGTNSYTLLIPVFTDSGSSGLNTGETYYKLSYQLNVTAPQEMTDIVASIGTGDFTWSASGAEWEGNSLVWYENGATSDQWLSTTIDTSTYDGPTATEIADIDNDGINDVVVGFQDSGVSIAWYRNEESDGSEWSSTPILICKAFDAYDYGSDGVADYATTTQQATESNSAAPNVYYTGSTSTGLINEDASLYVKGSAVRSVTILFATISVTYTINGYYVTSYDGTNYYCQNEICVDIETGDFDGDGDLDIAASFAHAVVYSSTADPNLADSSTCYGMFFNRGIYVFWNDGNWTKTQLEDTNLYDNSATNFAALSLAVGDLNDDGYDDIVAAYEDGTTGIWLNQYPTVIGISSDPETASFGTGSKVAETEVPVVSGISDIYAGHNSASDCSVAPSVAIADVDLNGYPDIIRSSTTSSVVTVIRTMYSSGTPSPESPIAESGNGTITNDCGYLEYAEGSCETLTEVYLETDNVTSVPSSIYSSLFLTPYDDNTTTEQDQNELVYYDGDQYVVLSQETMCIGSFSLDSTYESYPVAKVVLTVNYTADSSYSGTNHIQYSIDGVTWYETDILPTASSVENTSFDLYLAGIDTWDELESLRVLFYNDGTGTISFDFVNMEVRYAESRYLEWTYEISNEKTKISHLLTMTASLTETSERFDVYYSTDGDNWYLAFSFYSTTEVTNQTLLPHTTNSVYYIKVVTVDSTTSDTTNSSIVIDQLIITHDSPVVEWSDDDVVSTSFTLASGEFISALAVGDITTSLTASDRYPDIIVGTTLVGSSSTTQTLMVAVNTGSGTTFNTGTITISTSELAAEVGSNNALYNVYGIALGDFNGDGYTDIALVIGYAPGASGGTAASLWIYYNYYPELGQWDEQVLNMLATGDSIISISTGSINISLLYPIFGVVGMVTVGGVINKVERKRKK